MTYANNRFLGEGTDTTDTAPPTTVTRSPWAVLGMFGLLIGMAAYFAKDMDKKTLKKNGRRR